MAERCLLAVFAHPDDEAYRPRGTLALLARRGVRVQVLVATRGQAARWVTPRSIWWFLSDLPSSYSHWLCTSWRGD